MQARDGGAKCRAGQLLAIGAVTDPDRRRVDLRLVSDVPAVAVSRHFHFHPPLVLIPALSMLIRQSGFLVLPHSGQKNGGFGERSFYARGFGNFWIASSICSISPCSYFRATFAPWPQIISRVFTSTLAVYSCDFT